MPKTNVEFVTELMEFSNFGALAQLFVIDALDKWSARIKDADLSDWGDDSFIHPDAWKGVAAEINQKLKERK